MRECEAGMDADRWLAGSGGAPDRAERRIRDEGVQADRVPAIEIAALKTRRRPAPTAEHGEADCRRAVSQVKPRPASAASRDGACGLSSGGLAAGAREERGRKGVAKVKPRSVTRERRRDGAYRFPSSGFIRSSWRRRSSDWWSAATPGTRSGTGVWGVSSRGRRAGTAGGLDVHRSSWRRTAGGLDVDRSSRRRIPELWTESADDGDGTRRILNP